MTEKYRAHKGKIKTGKKNILVPFLLAERTFFSHMTCVIYFPSFYPILLQGQSICWSVRLNWGLFSIECIFIVIEGVYSIMPENQANYPMI